MGRLNAISYILSWYEKVDGDWKAFSREMSEEEGNEALSTKTIKGFKEGSIVWNVQITRPATAYVFTEPKPKARKPYYRNERW